jgi:ribulose-phosphate 3-epimerase
MLDQKGLAIPMGVDGGINMNTLPLVVKAGATQLIAGSAIFKGDVVKNIRRLREKANEFENKETRS